MLELKMLHNKLRCHKKNNFTKNKFHEILMSPEGIIKFFKSHEEANIYSTYMFTLKAIRPSG